MQFVLSFQLTSHDTSGASATIYKQSYLSATMATIFKHSNLSATIFKQSNLSNIEVLELLAHFELHPDSKILLWAQVEVLIVRTLVPKRKEHSHLVAGRGRPLHGSARMDLDLRDLKDLLMLKVVRIQDHLLDVGNGVALTKLCEHGVGQGLGDDRALASIRLRNVGKEANQRIDGHGAHG